MSDLIDVHSHILPGIDDGSSSIEMSLRMLKMESDQGIQKIYATPHFYADYDRPEHFLSKRKEAWEQLMEAVSGAEEIPEVRLGAEVHFFSGISDSDVLPQLTMGGKKCILLEMPNAPWTDKMYREIGSIYDKQGILPVIAHVDRYITPFRTHGIPERLADLPVLVQANASFFLRRTTQRLAMKLLRKDQIHLLGSDCHNLLHRPPRLGEAVEQIRCRLGEATFIRMLEHQDALW